MEKNKAMQPHYANINLDALPLTGLKIGHYAYCTVCVQFMKETGWVECGIKNAFRFPYPLKMWIGQRCNFLDRKTNHIFKQLRKEGFIEVAPDNQKFRVTDKFFVFTKATEQEIEQQQKDFESRYAPPTDGEEPTLKAKKIPFSESLYINDLERFKADLSALIKTPDVDYVHYHNTLTNYYAVENPHIVFVDWLSRCKKWIEQDRTRGVLVKIKKEKEPLYVNPISKLNDDELTKELDFYYDKIKNPETDSFEEYKETAQVFEVYAKEALARGERILRDKGRENAKRMVAIVKNDNSLKAFFNIQREKQIPMPTIEDLAKQMKT